VDERSRPATDPARTALAAFGVGPDPRTAAAVSELARGELLIVRTERGDAWVTRADQVILISNELLASALADADGIAYDREQRIVTFTAANGEWRYRVTGPATEPGTVWAVRLSGDPHPRPAPEPGEPQPQPAPLGVHGEDFTVAAEVGGYVALYCDFCGERVATGDTFTLAQVTAAAGGHDCPRRTTDDRTPSGPANHDDTTTEEQGT